MNPWKIRESNMSLLDQINQLITGYAIGVFILVLLAVVGIVRELKR